MTSKKENCFDILSKIDVSDKIETKKNLTYLSWTWSWSELMKHYPNSTYEISRYGERELPYVYDDHTGYMVDTKVTIEGKTLPMWLPVMNGANKAMKKEFYTYSTKYGDKEVEACSMFDVNKTIMRCLVKNIAMFGLGLYIYAGEDLPEAGSDKGQKYEELKKRLQTAVLSIKSVADINIYFTDILGNHDQIDDSKIIEKNLLSTKMKELNLFFDKDKKEFIEKVDATKDLPPKEKLEKAPSVNFDLAKATLEGKDTKELKLQYWNQNQEFIMSLGNEQKVELEQIMGAL